MSLSQAHPHGAMRRKDREITDRAEMDAIIASGKVMHLALADGGTPFVVPVFYAYDGVALYFHSAKTGTKMEMMQRNSTVCFCISGDHGVIESNEPCDFEARHRTVIGLGQAVFVTSEPDKVAALDRIVARFTDRAFEYPKANLKATQVVRIDITSLKGKKHGF